MVWEEWESAMAGCGLRTRAVRASIAEAGEQLRALLPFGKAALITDAGTDEQLTERVRASLRAYRPQCIFAEGEDASMPLFSLPDDVRAVVAVGPRSALAARFFCTLRGGFSLLIPLRPSAEELFAPAAPRPWAGYPLAPPDLVLADGEILQGAEAARADAALAALCAAELETDARTLPKATTTRARCASPPRAPPRPTLSLPAGREDVLAASAIFCLEKRSLPPFGCERAARAAAGGAGAVLPYFARRYESLFAAGRPRPYFVPAYAARAARAARLFGAGASEFFANVRVPTGEQSFRLGARFRQVRQGLLASARALVAFAARVCPPAGDARPAAAGRADASGAAFNAGTASAASAAQDEALADLYDASAEASPLLSAPALEREFGLLPNPQESFAPLAVSSSK